MPVSPLTLSHGDDDVTMNRVYPFKHTLFQLLILLALLPMPPTGMASVQASIDRPVIYDGESFTLVISSDAKRREMPDLSLLEKDFYVLGTGSSQQVQIINGVTTAKTSWTITLQPKTRGQFHIPPLRVGRELTNPIQVTVSAPPVAATVMDGQHIFIETEIGSSEKPIYLQQQILYTVRLVFDQPILDGNLSEPAPENALVEQLVKNNRYTRQRNGKSVTVIERRYAIFPEKSGELIIPPLRFTGSLVSNAAGRRQSSRIDPNLQRFFGGDPFAGVFNRGRPVTVQGRALSLQILPRPASYSGSNWLPSVELKLKDSWLEQPPEFKVGEPVSRTITIRAKGLLATLLPTLELDALDGVNVYPEQPVTETRTDGTWVYGISKQGVSYMPTKAGALLIPELRLNWWDTEAGVERTAVLPKWSVEVLPGKDLPVEPVVQAEGLTVTGPQTDSPAPEGVGVDDSLLETGWFNKIRKEYWLLLPVIAVVIFALYWRWNKRPDKPQDMPVADEFQLARKLNQRALQKRLRESCSGNDASAVAEILLQMSGLVILENPPKTLPALAAILDQGGEEIIQLDRFLYSTDAVNWDGQSFYEKFRNGLVFRVKEKPTQDALEPLYPG